MPLAKKSLMIAGHATSIALEPEFWAVLQAAAARKDKSLPMLIGEIDAGRMGSLSSALRLYALAHAQQSLAGG